MLLMVLLPQVHCLFVLLKATPAVAFSQHELVYTYYPPQPNGKRSSKTEQNQNNGKHKDNNKLLNWDIISELDRVSCLLIYCSASTQL